MSLLGIPKHIQIEMVIAHTLVHNNKLIHLGPFGAPATGDPLKS